MADYLRLRQICLIAPHLKPVAEDIEAIFGVKACFQDVHVGKYGLENFLFPIGTDFLEVVAPMRPDTAAGRFIERTKGHGGYMAIFQASDVARRKAHAAAINVRVANAIDHDHYTAVQLHPRDCRAAFIEFGNNADGDNRMGDWGPAGPDWKNFVSTSRTKRIAEVVMESPDPAGLAAHWARIIEAPLATDRGDPVMTVDGCTIRFVKGDSECMGTLVVQVADVAGVLATAQARGHTVKDGAFHLSGVFFRPVNGRHGNPRVAGLD